jgi:hypothetical protein
VRRPYTSNEIFTPFSHRDAGLANLAISAGTLTPVFDMATAAYTASVSHAVTSLTVTAAAREPNAALQVNGTPVLSGTPSAPIALVVGPNVVTTTVTAQDGVPVMHYVATVTRAPSSDARLSNLVLSEGTLVPAFDPATMDGTATVANGVASLTTTPTASEPNASIQVNGVAVPSSTPSESTVLGVGVTVIRAVVWAQDGLTSQTCTVTISQASQATLSELTLGSPTSGGADATRSSRCIVTRRASRVTRHACRQCDGKPRALADFALIGDGSTQRVDQALHVGQTQAEAFELARQTTVALHQRYEDSILSVNSAGSQETFAWIRLASMAMPAGLALKALATFASNWRRTSRRRQ